MAKLENDTKYVDFNYKEGYEVVNWLGVQETIKEWQGGSEKEKKKKKTNRVHEQTCISARAARLVLHFWVQTTWSC